MKKVISILCGAIFVVIAPILFVISYPIKSLFYMPEAALSVASYIPDYIKDKVNMEADYDIEIIPGDIDVVYYSQMEEPWASYPYGTSGNIKGSGCGPTSMAIVVSTLADDTVTPAVMADWAVDNGYRAYGNGSYRNLIPGAAKNWDLECEEISGDQQKFLEALAEGRLIIALMGKGHFTKGGHFIVLRGITEDGKVLVADPASRSRTDMEWDVNIIFEEVKEAPAMWQIWSADESIEQGE